MGNNQPRVQINVLPVNEGDCIHLRFRSSDGWHTAFELARSIERPNFETADLAQWMGVEIEIQRGTYCFPVGKLLSEYESLGYAFECSMIGYYQSLDLTTNCIPQQARWGMNPTGLVCFL